ncbi:MAG: diaminopimelate epimerase [Candidatus Limimorpha sp.]
MENIDTHKLIFSKYHGAGNDFVMVNAIKSPIDISDDDVFNICNRRTGIGADGLIVIMPSENYDFRMKYFNCDGHESTFCGNGGRCVACFAFLEGVAPETMRYEAIDGIHQASVNKLTDNTFTVSLSMKDITEFQFDGERLIIDTGSPHFVTRVNNLRQYDVVGLGARIRYDKNISADGVNVDFLEVCGNDYYIRTYERGVEDETLACGTGVTASAIAASLWFGGEDIDIHTSIATLNVKFEKRDNGFSNIVLTGPATHVCDGTYFLERYAI